MHSLSAFWHEALKVTTGIAVVGLFLYSKYRQRRYWSDRRKGK